MVTVPAHLDFTSTAYKEKMKELSVLSLICSCFYSQPHPNTIYQYGGELPKQLLALLGKGMAIFLLDFW